MLTVTVGGREVPVLGPKAQEAIQSSLFKRWIATLDPSFVVHWIDIHYVDTVGFPEKPHTLFIKLKAQVETTSGNQVPGIVFLRGGSVGILLVIECEGEEYTLLTLQSRFPAGHSAFPEIPAGMLDGSGQFSGVAARELEEETGLIISRNSLIDLTELAYGSRFQGIVPSAGGSDEFVRLFACFLKMTRSSLEALQGKITGVISEGETIALKVIPLRDLVWSTPDVKALSALTLYDALKRDGRL